jgi:hypothetical protein
MWVKIDLTPRRATRPASRDQPRVLGVLVCMKVPVPQVPFDGVSFAGEDGRSPKWRIYITACLMDAECDMHAWRK